MNQNPTNIPLTVKDFDSEKVGVCFGCGCYCGYVAYLKGNSLVDIYGLPNDPNGMGSLCSRGIALLQDIPVNPMRVRKILIREGGRFREGTLEEVRSRVGGKVGIFLDRVTTDLKDHLTALKVTDRVYSEAVHLPFRPSTLKPQEWTGKKVIVALECDPVFSEVMSVRWIVDAVEKGAYLLYVGSRFGTVAQKATESIIVKPPLVVRFLENLAEEVEGGNTGDDTAGRVAELILKLGSSVLLIGDTLLRTRWRGNVLRSLQRIRKRTGADYTVVGDVSPLPVRSVEDLIREISDIDTLITTGNPFVHLPDEEVGGPFKIHITLFPNLTANLSDVVIPAVSFQEREFRGYRNGFGQVRSSGPLVSAEGYTLSEVLKALFGVEVYDVTLPYLPPVEVARLNVNETPVEEEGVYILVDRTLVDDLGHWSLWTHGMEKEQVVRMNRKTAESLGVSETVFIGGEELKVRIDNNVADDTILFPDSFEETQPFDPGVRVGKVTRGTGDRVVRYG
ncbi:MAG: dehydrogenase [Aquificota bacterium]|nr:dehydrogenase [Aquificota bacterium]